MFGAAMGLVVYRTLRWKWLLPLLLVTLLVGLVFNNANGSPIPIQSFIERNTTDRTLQLELRKPIWEQSILQFVRSPIVGIGVNEVYINLQPSSPTPKCTPARPQPVAANCVGYRDFWSRRLCRDFWLCSLQCMGGIQGDLNESFPLDSWRVSRQ